ncbi:MAG: DUF3306 domain-containing protein [Piscinibacter sp.]|uniref:DUF3306 domain-containing protein n=1 Tax=Piscinibacter sp. TaxID=1903157 RepID=UPI003D096026
MSSEDGFLSRWAKRKALVREGRAPAEPLPTAPSAEPVAAAVPAAVPPRPEPEPAPAADPAAPPPTLEETATLTPASDFTRFVARDVDPTVKNAALKKLFADPHFNVMDGLDIYIDDYGKPDPLPAGMLRQMVQSQFLGLFGDEKKPSANGPAPAPAHPPEETTDEDADLRLQSHDAADAAEPGAGEPGAGQDAAGER